MPVLRPTFHESWHRVADLRPRLRTTVDVQRQTFRGHSWHVVRDAAGNDFFRLSGPAYHFVGLLDGTRTVAQAWRACNDALADDAPTQGEAIHLLGMMHSSNLLALERSDDADGVLLQHRRRKSARVRGYLANLLCIRIPLLDPDSFLDRWSFLFSWLFTPWGIVAWLLLVGTGVFALLTGGMDLASGAPGLLSPSNAGFLFLAIIVTKALHEFGHAMACKALGKRNAAGGEVHTLGVMLILFVPVPYVDTSSAWGFRAKRHRLVVAGAGMLVELAVAALAAVAWSYTTEATTLHNLCYNIMIVAGLATVLFNGNPLMRYDGYFMLADLLEIPNLAQRAGECVRYLVKRHVWAMEWIQTPAHVASERKCLLLYAFAAAGYRIVAYPLILLVMIERFFFIGSILAATAMVVWLLLPLGRFLRYLFTSPELIRSRRRALTTSLAAAGGMLAVLGLLPAPDCAYADGIVEVEQFAEIHSAVDGFVELSAPSGTPVRAGSVLLALRNPELEASRSSLGCTRRLAQTRRQVAWRDGDVVGAQTIEAQIAALERQSLRVEQDIEALLLRAPLEGTWVAPDAHTLPGRYVHRGDRVGAVASMEQVIIRATADQAVAGQLFAELNVRTQVRVAGRSLTEFEGVIQDVLPAGQDQLPSPALGQPAGGTIAVDSKDPRGTRSVEPFFEIRIRPQAAGPLLPGQRVRIRFTLAPKPLGRQCWQAFWRIWQRRFHTEDARGA